MRKFTTYLYATAAMLMVFSCREEFEIKSIDFESSLVVEATITTELKQQSIKLSRTYELDETGPAFENNAIVSIIDSNNHLYSFTQDGDGLYLSDIEFQAIQHVTYKLLINTQNGEKYQSSSVKTPPSSEITNLYAELITNDSGEEGVQVFVDADNIDNDAKYFRYEYEETYEVVSPYWFPYQVELTNYQELIVYSPQPSVTILFDTELTLREQEERFCYASRKSKGIIQTTTSSLENNTINRFPIRFINKSDGILRDRYSILVRQFVQSLESYTYYNTLHDLGNTESILSQSQPGFVYGNIVSQSDEEKKVIGYFDVTTVSEQRIFMDYLDFNIPQPEFLYECDYKEFNFNDSEERREIYRRITTFEDYNYNYQITAIPTQSDIWSLASPECTDCTSVSSNTRPSFWED